MPPAARGPVFTVSRPIFTGAACAIDGIGNALAPERAAAPATNLRRLIRRFMASSQGVFEAPEFSSRVGPAAIPTQSDGRDRPASVRLPAALPGWDSSD